MSRMAKLISMKSRGPILHIRASTAAFRLPSPVITSPYLFFHGDRFAAIVRSLWGVDSRDGRLSFTLLPVFCYPFTGFPVKLFTPSPYVCIRNEYTQCLIYKRPVLTHPCATPPAAAVVIDWMGAHHHDVKLSGAPNPNRRSNCFSISLRIIS